MKIMKRLNLAYMAMAIASLGSPAASAATTTKLEPHVSQFFGVAVQRVADGRIETQTLSVFRKTSRKVQPTMTVAPEACPIGSFIRSPLSVSVGLVKKDAESANCTEDPELDYMVNQLGTILPSNAERFRKSLASIFSQGQMEAVGLRINIRLERSGRDFRYQVSESASDEIVVNFVVPVSDISGLDPKASKRLLLELLAAATHEYVHGVAMLNGNSKKVSAVGDETIASIVEYVVGLLGAGCTARGSIELQDGDEIAFPVQYASYKKLLKQAKGNPAIEGYVRAMLNVANASRSTKFSANSQLDRAKLVLTARSALTYDSDLGVGPLGALPDEVTNAFVDELGCD